MVLSLLVGGCGNKLPGPVTLQLGPRITGITVPVDLNAGATFTFGVTTSGPPVVTYSWEFDGGAAPNTSTAVSPTVTLINPSTTDSATYTVTVMVTDADNRSDTETAEYTVGRTLNQSPSFVGAIGFAAAVNVGTVTFTIADPDDDDVAVTLELTAGTDLDLDVTAIDAGAGNYGPFEATLTNMTPDDIDFTLLITLDDDVNDPVTGELVDTVPGLSLIADAIYMFAPASVNVGDTFKVVVYASAPVNTVGYIDSIEIVYPAGFAPVTTSWNLGAVGGDTWAKDGNFWAASTDTLFEVATNLFFLGDTVAVNMSPMGASPAGVAAGTTGPLFSFDFTANAAGVQTLSFVHGGTHYLLTDGATTAYFDGGEFGLDVTVN
ncbi:MAG: hypothetical protein A2Y63_01810 [Candidatus Riflebacteria bacterium RBG_13_59_9]|nr:MAG: hypothetical protein A2Y63_01810 [Candidatus Riflebacteria bacterium RBG_13_59_9]